MGRELTEMVSTVLTPEEREALEREAEEVNFSRSAYIRRAVRASLGLGELRDDGRAHGRSGWRG